MYPLLTSNLKRKTALGGVGGGAPIYINNFLLLRTITILCVFLGELLLLLKNVIVPQVRKTGKDYHARCTCCGEFTAYIDGLCSRCKKRWYINGSPEFPKPTLSAEIAIARQRINEICDWRKAEGAFDEFMLSFASPSKSDSLRRLCWLHYVKLKSADREPVMRFFDALVQSYAVTIYEDNGGKFDNKRKQYQFCLGRSVVCPWNRRRQVGHGFYYNRRERANLQRRSKIMLQAFNKIFIGAGISRYLSNINNIIRSKK